MCKTLLPLNTVITSYKHSPVSVKSNYFYTMKTKSGLAELLGTSPLVCRRPGSQKLNTARLY